LNILSPKNFIQTAIALLLVTVVNAQRVKKQSIYDNVPQLQDVSGIWVNADTVDTEPTLRNFRGTGIVNRDMTSVSWFASAPYSGGYHSGVMKINGYAPHAQLMRWLPWEALRKASAPTYSIYSLVRMLPDNDAMMWQVEIKNNTQKTQQYHIQQDLIGFISRYAGETWAYPYPYPTLKGKHFTRDDEIVNVTTNAGLERKDFKITKSTPNEPGMKANTNPVSWPMDDEILSSTKYKVIKKTANELIIADTETQCFIAFYIIDTPDNLTPHNSGGTAVWTTDLKANAVKKIRYFMTYGQTEQEVTAKVDRWKNSFDKTFAGVETTWKQRWAEIFKPHNNLLSGNFPVLKTDSKAIKKVYYTGPLTFLYLLNTNLPAHKRIVLTTGPKWGASVVFFWDSAEWSSIMALADPEMMKEEIKDYVTINLDKYYGKDNYGGGGIGNPYRANYWALYQLIYSYITVTGDYAFLNESINGTKLIDIINAYALHWQKMEIYGQPGATDDMYKLADTGDDEWNLLECVPTYKHIVPSFNVGYVWMMRKTAGFYTKLGDAKKAANLNAEADTMARRVLKLYAGNGVWNVLYPNNKKIEQRHVLDFIFFGKFMHNDLPDTIKTAMVNFVNNELLTNTWMRAQSLQDVAAKNSDRPDHGPLGSFDGWPPATMDALTQLGYKQQAFDFYKRVYPVTFEGCWAQAHELWGPNKYNKNARVRIATRGWCSHEAVDGIAFSQVMLKDFFGFYPDMNGNALHPARQKINFNGTLYNVSYNGKRYNITSVNGNVKMNPTSN
jgi:hypothetical protein